MAAILSLDTTSEFGSIALAAGDRIVEELPLHSPDGFGHILFGQIDRLLKRRGFGLRDIDCFAAASGPGSFTGVRVGLAAVKGLAEALNKPVVAVSNLRALAWFGSADARAAILDARRGEIYGAVFDRELNEIAPETVAKFQDWIASLPNIEMQFLTPTPAMFAAGLAATRFAGSELIETPRALAGAIALIAASELRAGRARDAAAIDANYVRRSDAELLWKDR
jgi:tRNA threonylcarbamoyladenosine biosynthesis protein TsaB